MNKFGKIIAVVFLIVLSGHTGFAQIGSQQTDTLTLKINKTQSSGNSKGDPDNQADQGNKNAGKQQVKHIKASRPDMSKARNARPPNIVRPTGSRIPNGIGRPAGAVRPGHG
jgi:hypothetical protein